MAQDYAKTLNLPKTDFPMRANLPAKEPQTLKTWEDEKLYNEMMKNNEGKPSFVLHDGPPYANGNIHTGHALNKILKDFIFKNKNMSGYRMPYIHGWDTHGLPIELQMLKTHKVKRGEITDLEFRKLCAEFARKSVNTQMQQIKRLGCFGDFENSYMTLLPEFEARQIEIFGKMAEKGYIYKGIKPVYWCAHDETALAEAEIEYEDDPCDSIYVKFNVTDDKGLISDICPLEKAYFVIWTTTTWTLPGNVAICLGPDFEYCLVKYNDEYYIIAKELKSAFEKASSLPEGEIVKTFIGKDLEYIKTKHPFFDRISLVIVGDHVGLDSGTGCVHTAPGHGMDDFIVCKKYKNLEMPVPVDDKGIMNELAGKYCGLKTNEANIAILSDLKASGALVATEHIVHQYPHCWRCKSPIVYRATDQWFCSVDGFKEVALAEIKKVKWIPDWGEIRIENMVRDRSDWCISRQRLWGVPIPIFYCENCGKYHINQNTIKAVSALFEKEGSDAWYQYTAEEILPKGEICECGCGKFRKETDIMDVWFDSGSSYALVLNGNPGHEFPADVYLEGNDQYRGWFQSSLLTSVATRGTAPYKAVITHGMVVDGEGRKMSKSLGNGIDPLEVVKEYGADVLRLWVSSVDFTTDVRISKEILKQLSEIYRKIRNTIRIMLANLGLPEEDFDPNKDMLPYDKLYDIDKWILSQMNALVGRVRTAYDNYEFHLIYHDIHNFCTIDLSKLYIDITKDRVYVEGKNSNARRSAQTAMYIILNGLTRLLAPILSFTAEETWQFMAHLDSDKAESVFLNEMPVYDKKYECAELSDKWNMLFNYRDDVMKALELARAEKLIGKSLDAEVIIYGDGDNEAIRLFEEFSDELRTVFIASKVTIIKGEAPAGAFSETASGISVVVKSASGIKCDRCWVISDDTSADGQEQHLCPRCAAIIEAHCDCEE